MAKSILGQQLTSAFSPDGTGAPVVRTADAQGLSTLHNQSSQNNNPTLPYTGPAPLLNGESSLTRVKYIDNLPR